MAETKQYTVTYYINNSSTARLETAHVRAGSKAEAEAAFMKSHPGRTVVKVNEG